MDISQDLLSLFPKIKLPYEISIDKKVSKYDFCIAIPKGKKSLAWFTNYKGDNVCFIIELNENNGYNSYYIAQTSFDDSLSLGTIFYGTEFTYNTSRCFCIEDIFKFKGQNIGNLNFESKLSYLNNIFSTYLNQSALSNNYLIFGLPIMNEQFSDFIYETTSSAYEIDHVQFRYKDNQKIFKMKYLKPGFHYFNNRNEQIRKKQEVVNKKPKQHNLNHKTKVNDLYKIFDIKAEVDNDIYSLFERGTNKGYALISSYKVSVYLNNIFRNIKENKNLDLLEESDDEEEFENCDSNKFVDLEKTIKVKCKWEPKFKKWSPCIE